MRPAIQRILFLALSAAALLAALAAPAPKAEPWNILAEREGTYLQCTRPESPYGEILHFLVLDEPDSHGPFLGLYGPGTEGLSELDSGVRLTVTTRGTPHDIWPISFEVVKWKQTEPAANWQPPADVLAELADHGVTPVP